ncbi:MAG TPA: VOC family protein [Saprospiraceae bacterium]|nr:VOC family protein [Saprospiraceae bacterium]
MSNPVVWFEIAATDLERAKKFYSEVFQLEMQYVDMPDSPMYMMGSSAEGIAGASGALVKSADNIPSTSGTIVYFYCDDVAVEASRVEAAGGNLIVPKTSLGEFGFMAMFIDTEGNKVGMHSMS